MPDLPPRNPDEENLAKVFQALSQPARISILLAMAHGEVCVCHLEAALNLRQAYISQQLMLLRETGLITCRRVGRHIYYSLVDPRFLEILRMSAGLKGVALPEIDLPQIPGCPYEPDLPHEA